ncbi:MAG: DUF3467 domain-containing protein [Planctomycetota bacterium]|nr:MAG: DUF3467 domain-containing protein [Planctomycetota bacterium]REK43219.1 MAG: DUF3467 domain-containing protein [Planctomycetota bacterium]
MAEEKAETPADEQGAAGGQQRATFEVDDSHAAAFYANFCRVMGTPEELIIDLGLNKQPVGVPSEPIRISQRVIVNFFTAKRLLAALQMAVQRHEATFGVLETDVQKRIVPGARSAGGEG